MAAPPPQTFPYDYLFKVLIIGDASVGKVSRLSCWQPEWTAESSCQSFLRANLLDRLSHPVLQIIT